MKFPEEQQELLLLSSASSTLDMHFVSLENNKMFLFVVFVSANGKSEQEDYGGAILEECRRSHPYCQEHAPQKIVYKMRLSNENDEATKAEIDEIVRLFEDMFGADDVKCGYATTTTMEENTLPTSDSE